MADDKDDGALARQGIGLVDWVEPAMLALARETNDKVRALADREMEPHLTPGDFRRLLAEAARRAETDADRGS